ncbi:MAG: hypothetical protein QW158_04535 [Nitrososphaerales archaeon]
MSLRVDLMSGGGAVVERQASEPKPYPAEVSSLKVEGSHGGGATINPTVSDPPAYPAETSFFKVAVLTV